jgi:hypothetical protein
MISAAQGSTPQLFLHHAAFDAVMVIADIKKRAHP